MYHTFMIRKTSLSVLAFTYLFLGIYHFTRFDYFLSLVPQFLPARTAFTAISGSLDILAAVLIPFRATRKAACYVLLALLVFVFPFNLYIICSGGAGIPLPRWELIARIPFQFLLMTWIYWHSRDEKID